MISLCSPGYLSVDTVISSILKRGQVRYTEPEKGLIYADAFFLEAILKYKGLYKYFIEGEGPITISSVEKEGIIKNKNQLGSIQVIPNPVEDGKFSLTIHGIDNVEVINISIYDLTGKLTYTRSSVITPGKSVLIELEDSSHGIYILIAKGDNLLLNGKLILQ